MNLTYFDNILLSATKIYILRLYFALNHTKYLIKYINYLYLFISYKIYA